MSINDRYAGEISQFGLEKTPHAAILGPSIRGVKYIRHELWYSVYDVICCSMVSLKNRSTLTYSNLNQIHLLRNKGVTTC